MGVLYGVASFDQSDDLILDGAYLVDNLRKEWPGTLISFGSEHFTTPILEWSISVEGSERSLGCSIFNGRNHLGLGKSGGQENYNSAALWFRKIVPGQHRLFFYDDAGGGLLELLPTTTGADLNKDYWSKLNGEADYEQIIASGQTSPKPVLPQLEAVWPENGGLYHRFLPKKGMGGSALFSPDGCHLLTARWNEMHLWDTFSGELVHTFEGVTGSINSAAFSPDGKLIAAGGYASDGNSATFGLWETATGLLLHDFGLLAWSLQSVFFSPDGLHILTAHTDVTAKLWDTTTYQLVREFGKPTTTAGGAVVSSWGLQPVILSPDATKLAIATTAGRVELWEVASGELLHSFTNPTSFSQNPAEDQSGGIFLSSNSYQPITGLAFSPDSQQLVIGWNDATNRLYDLASGGLLLTFGNAGQNGAVQALAFSPDGKQVLLGLRAFEEKLRPGWNVAQLWDISGEGQLLLTLEGHQNGVKCVGFSPNGDQIVTGSYDGTVRVWDSKNGQLVAYFGLEDDDSSVDKVAFSPDGRFILNLSWYNVSLWEVAEGNPHPTPSGHDSYISSAAISGDGRLVITGSWDTTTRLWDSTSRYLLRIYREHQTFRSWERWSAFGIITDTLAVYQTPIMAVALSPDATLAATGAWDGLVRLWRVSDGQTLQVLDGQSSVRSLAFSPEGGQLVAGCEAKNAFIWDTSSGKVLRRLENHQGYVTAVAFSPDGALVATGSEGLSVCLWDAAAGQLVNSFGPKASEAGWLRSVAFSPDNRLLLTGGDDQTVRLWEIAGGRQLASLTNHQGIVTGVAFAPWGKVMASWDSMRELKLWQIVDDKTTVNLLATYHATQPLNTVLWQSKEEILLVGSGGPRNLPYLYRLKL